METNLETVKQANREYTDLYGTIFDKFIQLPAEATISDIKAVVDATNVIMTHDIKVGEKCVVAGRKFTYGGFGTIKTDYLHVYVLDNFEKRNVLTHWQEQKDGNFKTV